MPHTDRSRLMILMTVAALTLCSGGAYTEDEDQPTNDLPNPYQTTAPWGKLPQGRTWGALNAVAIDNDGESVWWRTDAARIPIPHQGHPRSSTTAALVQPSRRSSSLIHPATW